MTYRWIDALGQSLLDDEGKGWRMAYFWRCPECGRLFTLDDDQDAAEVAYGHDCEEVAR